MSFQESGREKIHGGYTSFHEEIEILVVVILNSKNFDHNEDKNIQLYGKKYCLFGKEKSKKVIQFFFTSLHLKTKLAKKKKD